MSAIRSVRGSVDGRVARVAWDASGIDVQI
jgi:hypothetical protein